MPTSIELSPEQLDALRYATTIDELVEQGGIKPLADDPFDPSYLERLTEDEKKELAQAHDYRDARKLQHVINTGDLSSAEASQATPTEVQEIIQTKFDPKYRLQFMKLNQPESVEEKDPGQIAEEVLVELMNESGLNLHAEVGSDYLDNIGKTDVVLFIPSPTTKGKEIILKVQAKSNPPKEVAARLQNETPNAILVRFADIPALLPFVTPDLTDEFRWAKAVMALAEKGNAMEKRNFVSSDGSAG